MERIIAGAMSGTSADGVDVALVRIGGRGVEMKAELLRHHALPFEADLKRLILRVRGDGACTFADLVAVGRRVSLAYAQCVREACAAAGIEPASLDAVAAHGQTLFHAPPDTVQWFDPALVAHALRCPVISDFRRADCAAGGQGAPLVPFADYVLFRHPTKTRILLNLGGIANITVLKAGGALDDVLAFDTGPANCISDWLCRTHEPEGPGYDAGGQRALSGTADASVGIAMARNAYTLQPPPKSTDGPAMIEAFKAALAASPYPPGRLEDLLATACQATAATIAMSLDLFIPAWRGQETEIYASGGGVDNACMMRELTSYLTAGTRATLHRTEALGIPPAAKEALAFALLGAATLDSEPSNVPSATGAGSRVILGSVTPAPGGN